jgi:crotonobetainyl-CoA:carnitine CoA-transferase CaiB-like acyl-CoA transferase
MAMPRMVPKLERTPAKTNWPGPKLGEHNQEILLEQLGYSMAEFENLKTKKVL